MKIAKFEDYFNFETHLFFDDAFINNEINQFVEMLVSVMDDSL